jgi:hypothetical protein
LHGSKRSALVYLVVGLFSVMMMIMVTTAAALPLQPLTVRRATVVQPLTVRRATVAPRGFPVWVEGYCEYFIVP